MLIYRNARNEKCKSSMGLLWMQQWSSQIRKRSIIRSNSARHSLLFCETWHSQTGVDEEYALSTGEGLWTFWWNVVPSSWTVGPEDESKLDSWQGETSQMTCIFTNTTVRISPPPTVVLKRQQETTNWRCVKSQKSADLIYTAFEAWNHATVEVLRFLSSECQENAQTEVGRVFSLLCCSHVWWSFQM